MQVGRVGFEGACAWNVLLACKLHVAGRAMQRQCVQRGAATCSRVADLDMHMLWLGKAAGGLEGVAGGSKGMPIVSAGGWARKFHHILRMPIISTLASQQVDTMHHWLYPYPPAVFPSPLQGWDCFLLMGGELLALLPRA